MELERLFGVGHSSTVTTATAFTNRDAEAALFGEALAGVPGGAAARRAVEDLTAPRRNVLMFYGMGGIGKTTLSKELQRRFDEKLVGDAEERISSRIDFSELSAFDAEMMLLRVRACLGQSSASFPAFDLAFAAYWERMHPGEPLREFLDRRSSLGRINTGLKLADQIQNSLDSLLGGTGLVGTAWNIGSMIKDGAVRRITERRILAECPYFEPLLAGSAPDEVRPFLPVLLAWDLSRHQAENSSAAVIFIDTWETVQQQRQELGSAEDVLTRLVYLMPNVLFVLTGRSELDWTSSRREVSLKYSGAECWPELVPGVATSRQLPVGALSPEDCERYLTRRLTVSGSPAIPPGIRHRIVVASEGLPLYLDLSAEHYDKLLGLGRVVPEEFGHTLPSLVTRVMRDLGEHERNLLRTASLLRAFDRETLRAAVPHVPDAAVQRFLRRQFVRNDRQGWLAHSLHDSLRESIRVHDEVTEDPWSAEEWRETGDRIMAWLGRQVRPDVTDARRRNRSRLAECFLQGFILVPHLETAPDWLLDCAFVLRSLGQWHPFQFVRTLEVSPGGPAEALAAACLALHARETGDLAEAQRLLDVALDRGALSPTATRRLSLERAEVLVRRNLDDRGEAALTALMDGADDVSDQAAYWLAVLDERRGRYRAAIRALDAISARAMQRQVRSLRGFVLLANGMMSAAEDEFLAAGATAHQEGHSVTEGLLAENLAWTVGWHDRNRALPLAEEALELNRRLGSRIQVARSQAARALARVGRDDLASVLSELDESMAGIRATGFMSDLLNPLLVRLFACCLHGDLDRAAAARQQISRVADEYRLHRATDLLAGWMLQLAGGPAASGRPDAAIEWIDDEALVRERWTAALRRGLP